MHKWGEVEDRLNYEIQDWIRIWVYTNNWIIISCRVTYRGSESVLSFVYEGRMVYAFSRDGAVPLSRFWHKVNGQEVPLNAVWLSALVAFVFALPVRCHPFLLHDLSISLCA
jgi:amino acid transporter